MHPSRVKSPMLVAFTMKAKAGREKEFEALLNDPEAARLVAQRMGATRNTLFLSEGRMVRVLEFPEGAKPRSLLEIAAEEPRIDAFLRRLSGLVEDGFDMDAPETLAAFNKRITLPLAFDVRP